MQREEEREYRRPRAKNDFDLSKPMKKVFRDGAAWESPSHSVKKLDHERVHHGQRKKECTHSFSRSRIESLHEI